MKDHRHHQQAPISNFFTKRPKDRKVVALTTPEKLGVKRSDSVLSKASTNDGFDEFGSSDTSFDSPELNNFRNPLLNRNITQGSTKFKKVLVDLTNSSESPERPERPGPAKRGYDDLLGALNSMGNKKLKPTFVKPKVEVEVSSDVSLSKEQNVVLTQVIDKKKNVFYTGSAGTGKSVVLRQLVKRLKAKYGSSLVGVTASTGLAACNIGGQTLHRFLGIGLGTGEPKGMAKSIKAKPMLQKRWNMLKVLIIDEISMIDGILFSKLEELARLVRQNNKPFGGIQIVCTGDFFQLPPVGKNQSAKYCFEVPQWNQVIEKTILLTQVFRQSGDNELIDMLNALRFGDLDTQIAEKFMKLQKEKTYDDGIEPTELFPTREEVKRANDRRLQLLTTKSRTFVATDKTFDVYDSKLLDNLMCEQVLILKPGAQVMYLKNRDDNIVNGSIGKVIFMTTAEMYIKIQDVYNDAYLYDESLLQEINMLNDRIGQVKEITPEELIIYDQMPPERQVKFDVLMKEAQEETDMGIFPVINFKDKFGNDSVVYVTPEDFTIEVGGAGGKKREITRSQLPLLLSWAMSIHKAQGQTIQRLRVDLRRIFEKGQVYVALSRAVNKENLEIKNFDPKKIMASTAVKEFYATLETF